MTHLAVRSRTLPPVAGCWRSILASAGVASTPSESSARWSRTSFPSTSPRSRRRDRQLDREKLPVLIFGLPQPAARVVDCAPGVAQEPRIDRGARVGLGEAPPDRVAHPVGPLAVEVGELAQREGAAEAAPKLVHDKPCG